MTTANGPIQTRSGPRCHFQPSAVETQSPELKLLAVLSVVTTKTKENAIQGTTYIRKQSGHNYDGKKTEKIW